MTQLTAEELAALVHRVFAPTAQDHALAILVDLPDQRTPDHEAWRARRQMALDWCEKLRRADTGLQVDLYLYRNVGLNNADLPLEGALLHRGGTLPVMADGMQPERELFASVFDRHSIIIAPTQFSATAPLKLAAREHRFRAATMPGFTDAMVPALRLDYVEINRRVHLLKDVLDRSDRATILFVVDGGRRLELTLDLQRREAHASGGVLHERGTAGNLPSGEAYIVPYEGEAGPSRSAGELPVQFGEELVVYAIENNRAVRVSGEGQAAARESALLRTEPAYGNLAELGLGVLSDFGIEPGGEILLDEKLGLHIAFGRSDHFGGQVGARDFSRAEAVVHIDRVYLPATQPRVRVASVDLHDAAGNITPLIRDDRYVIGF